jgi:hypothetical protein
MYSVHQHWDPLKACIVGRSYSPEFYSFIANSRVRAVMERIARETEEDYQKLVTLLESFGVTVLRPTLRDDYKFYLNSSGRINTPPMSPRDFSIMLGNEFYFKARTPIYHINKNPYVSSLLSPAEKDSWDHVLDHIRAQGNPIINNVPDEFRDFNSAVTARVGKDLYTGTAFEGQDITDQIIACSKQYPNYRWHSTNTAGHSDGTYCPVKPGLIVSLYDIQEYADTFPGWEVVYLPGQSWAKVSDFNVLKQKNKGKWWVPGEELNDEFTEFVEGWLNHWVGFVEETVFDVNMLVVDENNVICNNYNEQVFNAFKQHNITPHIVNFRHRYFWDGGLHCITSDLHRPGTLTDYFPERLL